MLLLVLLLCCFKMNAQSKDTILNTILSKPLFYNIVEGENQQIYAGTSEGIFTINEAALTLYSNDIGYISLDKKGLPEIDENGIKYHRGTNFNHLLPYYSKDGVWTYYARSGNLFYLSAGGKLYAYDILPYQVSYDNFSIRSISKNIVGTYTGIYLNNKKLDNPAPKFTHGYVREIKERGFICSSSLFILEKEAMQTGNLVLGENFFSYEEPDNLKVYDIVEAVTNTSYFIATQNKLLLVGYNFTKEDVLFKKEEQENPILLIHGDENKLFFTAENKLMSYHYRNKKIIEEFVLDSPILGGLIFESIVFLITKDKLYRYDVSTNNLESLSPIQQGHSILSIYKDQLIIGTDLGLFHFDLVTNKLSVVVKHVEFNKLALYLEEHPIPSLSKIHAGSINGLYSITLGKLPEIINSNKLKKVEATFFSNTNLFLAILSLLLILTVVSSIMYYKNKLKLVNINFDSKEEKATLTKAQIETFITEHISTASIKTIIDAFNITAPHLYTLFEPDKPGTYINQQRIQLFNRLLAEKKSIDVIAKSTGFSPAYLKKLMTQKKNNTSI